MKQSATAKRPGRPRGPIPKKGAGGKGRVLSINVSDELRNFIESEAAASGRPMSQVAERWMDEARKGRAAIEQMVGGYDLVPVVQKLGEIAREVSSGELDPEFRRAAVFSGWTDALDLLLPRQSGRIARLAQQETEVFKQACAALLKVIEARGKNDPAYKAALRPTAFMETGALANAFGPGGLTPVEVLRRGVEFGNWALTGVALDALAEVSAAIKPEIRAVAEADRKLAALADEMHLQLEQAQARGVAASRRALGLPISPMEAK